MVRGAHGRRGERYEGESELYGPETWPRVQKDWMNGSKLALLLIWLEQAGALTRSRDFHWKRHVHLTTNQLDGTWIAEIELCLAQALDYLRHLQAERIGLRRGETLARGACGVRPALTSGDCGIPEEVAEMRFRKLRFRGFMVGLALAGLVVASAAAGAGVKLPKRLTTPTGNFITLYAFHASGAVASADVGICTSAHTPAGTEAIPEFFTLSLSNGSSVHISLAASKSPALVVTPLGPKQCVRGWISFAVPHGAHASALVYTYGRPLRWKLA